MCLVNIASKYIWLDLYCRSRQEAFQGGIFGQKPVHDECMFGQCCSIAKADLP